MADVLQRPESGQILASVPIPVLLISSDNNIAFANDASEAFFGRSKKRLESQSITDALQFESDRMNVALVARDSDISAQDMELKT
ncbi:MAG: PAS domain-containing protein, partial [Usitatibacteraceae bacterium]